MDNSMSRPPTARPAFLFSVTVLCFLLAPSKVAAIAYALLLGGIVAIAFVGLGVMGAISSLFRRLRS